jgi:hypothetical protein
VLGGFVFADGILTNPPKARGSLKSSGELGCTLIVAGTFHVPSAIQKHSSRHIPCAVRNSKTFGF